MSVGHVARILENFGLPTVIIAAQPFGEKLASMSLPRVLLTPFPMGRPLGRPNNPQQHLNVIKESLNLLKSANQGNTIKLMDINY